MNVYALHPCLVPMDQRRGSDLQELELQDGCESRCGCSELNLNALQEQQVLQAPAFQPIAFGVPALWAWSEVLCVC